MTDPGPAFAGPVLSPVTMSDLSENLFQSMSAMLKNGIDPQDHEGALWARYGETVAVLTLDSTGFTRVSQSHGIVHFLSRIMQLRDICIPLLEQHNCKRNHFAADNIFAAFEQADDAVKAANALHRGIHESRLQLTQSERYRISIGIGYGRLLYSETLEGYFGEEMNFACKLGEDVGKGDETLITIAAFEQADPKLLTGFEAAETSISGVRLPFHRRRFLP